MRSNNIISVVSRCILGIFASLLSLTSCDVDGDVSTFSGDLPQLEERLTLMLSHNMSRVVDDGETCQWEAGDEVAVSTSDLLYSNVKYVLTKEDSSLGYTLAPNGSEWIKPSQAAVDYYLYYPYSDSGTVEVDLNDSDLKPILKATANNSGQNKSSVSFENATNLLARVRITLKAKSSRIEDLVGASITVSGAYSSATFSYVDGLYNLQFGDVSSEFKAVDDSSLCALFYVIPTSLANLDVEFTVTLPSDETLTFAIDTAEWIAGKSHNYRLDL